MKSNRMICIRQINRDEKITSTDLSNDSVIIIHAKRDLSNKQIENGKIKDDAEFTRSLLGNRKNMRDILIRRRRDNNNSTLKQEIRNFLGSHRKSRCRHGSRNIGELNRRRSELQFIPLRNNI
ncbi:unnamed protein product [Meganyctiphanes norvegica]|uniref:Uncharacterized protein n=1 Tax=Meganyctiphanes norvegica TaxID=48144 RepID=A0AAV2Q9N9_MEGNR